MRYSSISKYQGIILSLSLALMALSPNQTCWAQQSNVNGAPTTGGAKKMTMEEFRRMPQVRAPKRVDQSPINDTLGKPEPLPADKVSFDDIPPFTGKAKYRTGAIYHQNDIHATTLMLVTYSSIEPKDQVKEWYTNALRMYGWNITFQSPTVINATNSKTGNMCNLQFCDAAKGSKTERSLLQIDYSKIGKQ